MITLNLAISPILTKTHSNFSVFEEIVSLIIFLLFALEVSVLITIALIGTPIIFYFLLVIISTVAVIPGLNGDEFSGLSADKSL